MRPSHLLLPCLILGVLSMPGCGGGGGASSNGGTGTGTIGSGSTATPPSTFSATASFHVDVTTGQVTITPQEPASRSVLSGSAVGFNSSVVVDEPSLGLKSLKVSLTNNWGAPIGVDTNEGVTGTRVVFQNIINEFGVSDLGYFSLTSTTAGTGTAGYVNGFPASAQFNGPTGVAVGPDGTVYVVDRNTNRIRTFKNGQVGLLAGSGLGSSLNGLGATASFGSPFGIALGKDGALYVTESSGNRIRRITSDGRATLVAGTGVTGSTNGTGDSATFNSPRGITVGPDGTIYVADTYGQYIRKIVLTGSDPTLPTSYSVTTYAGTGASGAVDGPAGTGTLSYPVGLAVLDDGGLYVADSATSRIRRISPAGDIVTIAGAAGSGFTQSQGTAAQFRSPLGIVANKGSLFISDSGNCSVRQMSLVSPTADPSDPLNWLVTRIAGGPNSHSVAAGYSDGTGVNTKFNSNSGLAFDASGNIYVADTTNNRLRKIAPRNGLFPISIPSGAVPSEPIRLANPDGIEPSAAGQSFAYINYPGSLATGQTSAVKEWQFAIPAGVTAFDFSLRVESANTEDTELQSGFNQGAPNVYVRTLAGKSTQGYIDGSGTDSRFGALAQAVRDPQGNIYVADVYVGAIRRISPDGTVRTIAGGKSTASDVDGPGTSAVLQFPRALAIDSTGTRLYAAELNCVRLISYVGGDPNDSGSYYVSTVAGVEGTQGHINGDGGTTRFTSTFALALVNDVTLMVYDSGIMRLITFGGGNRTVASNYQVSDFAGSNANGSHDGTGLAATFYGVNHMTADHAGNVYAVERENRRVRVINLSGVVTTLAGGTSDSAVVSGSADGPGAMATFTNPQGIAVDAAGYFYVTDADARTIRKISPNGNVTTVFSNGTGATDGDGTTGSLLGPVGCCLTPDGSLIFADGGSSVRIVENIITSGNAGSAVMR